MLSCIAYRRSARLIQFCLFLSLQISTSILEDYIHVDVIKLSVMLLDSFYHNVISAMALPVLSYMYARSVYLIQASTQLEGKMAQPES